MTRDELISCIEDDVHYRSCPEYKCLIPDYYDNAEVACRVCAERQLAEYEANIRAEAVREAFNKAESMQLKLAKELSKGGRRNGQTMAQCMATYLGHIKAVCKRLMQEDK